MTVGGEPRPTGASKIFATFGAVVGWTTRLIPLIEAIEMVEVTFGICDVAKGKMDGSPEVSKAV